MLNKKLEKQNESLVKYECPICLFPLIQPITLTCGHKFIRLQIISFCQSCIRNTYFQLSHQSCPLCRQFLVISPKAFKINVLLQAIIQQHYFLDLQYTNRLNESQKIKRIVRKSNLYKFMTFLFHVGKKLCEQALEMVPLLTITMLFLLILTIRQAMVNKKLREVEKHFTEEINKIISAIKKQIDTNDLNGKDVDMQNLIFTKLVKYLFTNCVRF